MRALEHVDERCGALVKANVFALGRLFVPFGRKRIMVVAMLFRLTMSRRLESGDRCGDLLQGDDALQLGGLADDVKQLAGIRLLDLLARQKALRAVDPFGGFNAVSRGAAMLRVYASPGSIYEPEWIARDY